MSTNDVPGAKATNGDKLAMGCWAEHADGSMIFVNSTEGGKVVYSMFDTSKDPVVEYRDAMPLKGFEKQFSYPNKDKIAWNWHDKTPMPWDRVMAKFPAGTRHASAGGAMTVAERIAERLDLRAGPVIERELTQPGAAVGIMQRLGRAIDEALRA